MKSLSAAVFVSSLLISSHSFSPLTPQSTKSRSWGRLQVVFTPLTEEEISQYEQLGIEQGKIALGVKKEEVLKYIGTRDDLIKKTLADIPEFDQAKAEEEVDKYFMDAEMLKLYIQYGKEVEKDPDFVVPESAEEDEGFFSVRTLVIGYLGYVAATSFPEVFRRYVGEQEVAGTWTPTGIGPLDEWIQNTSPEYTAKAIEAAAKTAAKAAAAAADVTAQSSADSVQSVVDTVQSSI